VIKRRNRHVLSDVTLLLKMYSLVLMTHVWPDSPKIIGITYRPIKHDDVTFIMKHVS